MREYILLLIGVIVISWAASMIAPEGSLKKYVSLLVAVCLISAIISPLENIADIGFESDINGIFDEIEDQDYESVFYKNLTEASGKDFCALLKAKMMRDLDMGEEDLDIDAKICVQDGEYKLEYITVILYKKGITQDPAILKKYTLDLVGKECGVVYG